MNWSIHLAEICFGAMVFFFTIYCIASALQYSCFRRKFASDFSFI